jgi:SAM-dependent methyltransferase
MVEMWNQRFSDPEYVYGKEPNEFFKEQIDKLPAGSILLLAEGEGRNAVYAAKKGWQADAVDLSEKAKEKALALASENNVKIKYAVSPLESYNFPEAAYDVVAFIFMHLPGELVEEITAKAIKSLKPGGKIITEVYEKEQLKYDSGGPKDENLLYSLEDFVNYFSILDFDLFKKEIVTLSEGKLHNGKASVIRFTGTKPAI